MLKIQGKENLVKDPSSNAVINTDRDGLKAARLAKKRILDSRQKEQEMEERVEKLENLLSQLLGEKSNG